jgi:UDP-N-acetylglucosamine diphosphorylase/glucosamine-1-phosphate N-acetyltransferase
VLGAWFKKGPPPGSIVIGDHPLFIEEGAVVEPSVCFDVSAGPVLLRRDSHVQAFTRLVGPLYVGVSSLVSSDKIAASSIGDVCKVHGELSNTIFIGHANKGHDGFVGHSILGRWVNLGAGTITSNLKNTYGPVSLWTPEGIRDSGMQFLGTLFGDHAKTGIGLRLTTGCVLGAGANVFGSAMPPKVVSPFSWGEADALSDYRLDKFLEVAERMMARRHVPLTAGARVQLTTAFESRWVGTE